MNPYYENKEYRITLYCGDCMQVLNELPRSTIINSVITSPPYAKQREMCYKSIPEDQYPQYTAQYFELIRPLLVDNGSIFVVIRPHIQDGVISNYVLKTRLLLEEKWGECEELIWIKPDSPPLGSVKRPRRAWESILWFGKSGDVYCNPKPSNIFSKRIGLENVKQPKNHTEYIHGESKAKQGIARDKDYIEVGTGQVENGLTHPALYPIEVPMWLIRLSTKPNDMVLDLFGGLNTTGIACLYTHRQYIGIECNPDYCEESVKRFQKHYKLLKNEKTKKQQTFIQFIRKEDNIHNN